MKNKIKIIVFLIISANAFFLKLFAQEPFIFEVEEINISKNATFFSSDKRGEIKSDDGLKIISDKFNYDKSTNILNLYGNITIYDKKNDISISSNKLIYFKNDERFFSEGKTKAHIYSKYTFESFDVLFNRKEMFLTSSNITTNPSFLDCSMLLLKVLPIIFFLSDLGIKSETWCF